MLDHLEENMKTLIGKDKPLKKALVEGDTDYFSEANLQEASKRSIEVILPEPQFRQRDPYFAEKKREKVGKSKKFTIDDFTYDHKKNCYICPAGKELRYISDVVLRNNSGKQYCAQSCDCAHCHLIDRCIKKRGGGKPARAPRKSILCICMQILCIQ